MFWHTGDILVLCSLNRFVDRIWLLICVYLRERERACSLKVMFVQVSSKENVLHLCSPEVLRVCGLEIKLLQLSLLGEEKWKHCSLTSPTWTALFSSFSSSSLFFFRIIEPLCLNEIALKECSTTLAFTLCLYYTSSWLWHWLDACLVRAKFSINFAVSKE